MDCVYVCRDGDNEELRYSIRSVQKNLPHNNVWVVGAKPDWYTGNFIKVPPTGGAYKNVRNSLRHIINNKEISDTFVLMNDDFFILKPIDEVKYYYSGLLKEKVKTRVSIAPSSLYTSFLGRTQHELECARIKDPLDYELHVPIVFEKDKLSKVVDSPGLWRSMYCNMNSVGGEQMDDVKIYSKGRNLNENDVDIANSTFISTEDVTFVGMRQMIHDLFPEPSQYEK